MTQRTDLPTDARMEDADHLPAAGSAGAALSTADTPAAHSQNRARRAVRIAVALPVEVQDQFGTRQQARTQFVMIRGAVLATNADLSVGHQLTLHNLKSGKSAECQVVSVEPGLKGISQIEVEFFAAQPDFWPVQFPLHESRVFEQPREPRVPLGEPEPVPASPRLNGKELVVLADAVAENFSATASHSREKFAAKVASVDSVAQFRAANRAAHRRAQRMKAVYSLFTLAGLIWAAAIGRSWINHHPDGVQASSTPIIQSVTSVTQKISQALPKKSSSSAQPASAPPALESEVTPQPVGHRRSSQPPPIAENLTSNVAVAPAESPAEAGQPAQPEVLVRHGSSFAAAHKLATEESGEAPVPAPLQVTEGVSPQPKPQVLNDVVAAVSLKTSEIPPQATKATSPARLIQSVPAQYPAMARQLRVEGAVLLSVDVDTAGNVAGVKALSGPPLLRQAAIDSVKRWKYQPATSSGQPVASIQTVKVDFHWR